MSERRACSLAGQPRSVQQYRSVAEPVEGLVERLVELAGERPRFGYRRLTILLRREGFLRTNWVTPDDAHWGELGHRRAATAIYGELERRGYFEPLELDAWPDAAAAVDLFDRGAAEAAAEPAVGLLVADQPILPALTRDDLTGPHAAQIHGGVESDGTLGPFASLILARGGGRSVTATVEGLGRSELDGVRVALSVDGVERDAGSLAADGSLTLRAELGPEFDTRPFVSLRLVSDDYAYVGDDLRRLASGRLVRAAIE